MVEDSTPQCSKYGIDRLGIYMHALPQELFNNDCLTSHASSCVLPSSLVKLVHNSFKLEASIGVPLRLDVLVEHEVIDDFYQEIRLG